MRKDHTTSKNSPAGADAKAELDLEDTDLRHEAPENGAHEYSSQSNEKLTQRHQLSTDICMEEAFWHRIHEICELENVHFTKIIEIATKRGRLPLSATQCKSTLWNTSER